MRKYPPAATANTAKSNSSAINQPVQGIQPNHGHTANNHSGHCTGRAQVKAAKTMQPNKTTLGDSGWCSAMAAAKPALANAASAQAAARTRRGAVGCAARATSHQDFDASRVPQKTLWAGTGAISA